MARIRPIPKPSKPWHALLAPLPNDVAVCRQPVGSPEVLSTPEGAAIAGWEQLTVELSAGPAGLRHILVVLTSSGQLISASDTVLYRSEISKTAQDTAHSSPASDHVEFHSETIGGRFELDGTFRGTHWETSGVESPENSEPKMNSKRSAPSAEDIAAIKALVADLIKRQPN
jgi:hypothetical protein